MKKESCLNSLRLPPAITVSKLGATFPEKLENKTWKGIWKDLQAIEGSLNWIIGDWINYGIKTYGSAYALALDATSWQYERLRNVAYVCGRVELSLRNDNLDWSHHTVVAPLDQKEQKRFLAQAVEEGLTVSQLRIAVRQSQATTLATSKPPIGFIPAAWLTVGLRWFRQQEILDWDEGRKQTLRTQLKPLVDIYNALAP